MEHYIKPDSREQRMLRYFLLHPEILVPEYDLFNIANFEHTEDIYQWIRDIREHIRPPAGIITIKGEFAHAYYPKIRAGMKISPEGYRPIPVFAADGRRAKRTRELYERLRIATVQEDQQTARSALIESRYDYLTLLAEAYIKRTKVSMETAGKELNLPLRSVSELRSSTKRDLERLTRRDWTFVYSSSDEDPDKTDMTRLHFGK